MENYDAPMGQCPACHSKDLKNQLIDFRKNQIKLCNQCQLQFMDPQYSNAYLDKFYENYNVVDDFNKWEEPTSYGHNHYMKQIESVLDMTKPGRRFFDFGCGSGHFMDVAKKRGWDVEGYEVDQGAIDKLQEKYPNQVYCGDFFKLQFEKKYDLIVMHQVLEHLKEPSRYMDRFKEMLNPGGSIFVAVPNIKSLSNRYKNLMDKLGTRKGKEGSFYDTDHHLLYFSKTSLPLFLKNKGFEVLKIANSHKVFPGQSSFDRSLKRNITDKLISNSAFFVVAQKSQ